MTKISQKQLLLDRIYNWPGGVLWVFIIRQAWAAIFAGLLLGAIIFTNFVHLPWLSRYDWLFIFAILIQLLLLATKLERPREVITILLFHLVGLGMELFKTSEGIGSWSYPGDAFFRIATVPLFSGFMYAAVGSYMARAWRVMDFEFTHYPRRLYTIIFAVLVYSNFFTHHFIYDFRYILFVCMFLIYRRTVIYYRVNRRQHSMPMLLAALLTAFFIWIAENIATFTKTWLYPSQLEQWHVVSLGKYGSWLLLMAISFIMIDLLHYMYNKKRTL